MLQVSAGVSGKVGLTLAVLVVRENEELLLEEGKRVIVHERASVRSLMQIPLLPSKSTLNVGVEDGIVFVKVYVVWNPFPATATVSMNAIWPSVNLIGNGCPSMRSFMYSRSPSRAVSLSR